MACKVETLITKLNKTLESTKLPTLAFNSAMKSVARANKRWREEADSIVETPIEVKPTDSKPDSNDIVKQLEDVYKKERKTALKHLPKELSKAKVATSLIGQGVGNSSANTITATYDAAGLANTGKYSDKDVIFLTANGNRKDRFAPVKNGKLQGAYTNVDKAIAAGASFVADSGAHLSKSNNGYNVGEEALANYLKDHGYTREDKANGHYGLWTKSKPKASTTAKSTGNYHVDIQNAIKDVHKIEETLNLGLAVDALKNKELGYSYDVADAADGRVRFMDTTTLLNKLKAYRDDKKPDGMVTNLLNTVGKDIDYLIQQAEGIDLTDGEKEAVRTHEYIHVATVGFMESDTGKNDPKTKYIESLYKEIKDYADNNPKSKLNTINNGYWKTNKKEFIAELLSNKKLAVELSKLDGEFNKTAKPKDSILNDLVKTLLSMLGIDSDTHVAHVMNSMLNMNEAGITRSSGRDTMEDMFFDHMEETPVNMNEKVCGI